MRNFALVVVGIAALGAGACQRGTGNNSSTVTINGAAVSQSLENGAQDVGNFAAGAGNVIANGASKAGDVIENTAKSAWNGVQEGTRDLTDGEHGGNGNSSANKTGR